MAAEPKTRPTDVPVADFIASIEHPTRRADAEVVCRMLQEVSGQPPVMWGDAIVGFGSYRSPTGDWPRIGFSPRKANLSLRPVRLALLRELAATTWAAMARKYPT
jgi:hypothetical protein